MTTSLMTTCPGTKINGRASQQARERLNTLLVHLSELEQDAALIEASIAEMRDKTAEREKVLAELERRIWQQ